MGCVLALAACGGGERSGSGLSGVQPMAAGPIADACLASDRKARSVARCGCIQAVANDTLDARDQRRAVGFYKDLQAAQDARQSQRPVDQRFWAAYMTYAAKAERICA